MADRDCGVPYCAGRWRGHWGWVAFCALLVTALPWSFAAAASKCELKRLVEFPITMTDLRPLMNAKINGTDVQFLVDSGAFYSMISAASAAELKLSTYPAPFGLFVQGVGGSTADTSLTRVKTLQLAGVPLHDIEFLVGGSEVGAGSIGVLGQNVLRIADVEYDLGQGLIRLMKPHDCGGAFLGYWVNGVTMPYSVINIEGTTPQQPYTRSVATVNGSQIHVMFDSGAGVSMLSLKAAARAGIKPDSPGVLFAGVSHGIGKAMLPSYIARFASFKIGDEEIKNARLRIADLELQEADMLIGADFFLSHRIYVASSQRKLYFTYNGGPVFNLASAPPAAGSEPGSTAPASAASAAGAAGDAPAPRDGSAEPQQSAAPQGDAAEYARRGAAFASRRDFEQALANLNRACELAPENPDYLYERGLVHLRMGKADAALADLDAALALKADHVPARVARAEVAMQRGDKERARADLDAASAAALPQADVRLTLGHAYERVQAMSAALAQFDLWIAAHAEDARLPEAQSARCWVRAGENIDLPLALKDCNAAVKHTDSTNPLHARALQNRGLLWLRMGEYDKSIADCDAVLKTNAKNAACLYMRGIDKLRKQRTAEGDADIALAKTLVPKIADEYGSHGISP